MRERGSVSLPIGEGETLTFAKPDVSTDPQLREPPEDEAADHLPFEGFFGVVRVATPEEEILDEDGGFRSHRTHDQKNGQGQRSD